MVNRTQALVLGVFVMAVTSLLAILVAAHRRSMTRPSACRPGTKVADLGLTF
jgi:hypothetical protein